MRSENTKIVEEGIQKLRRETWSFFDCFHRFLSKRCVFDFFVLNGISCLILLLAIISRVFNQLILVKLFFYNNTSRCSLGSSCRDELICMQLWACELA